MSKSKKGKTKAPIVSTDSIGSIEDRKHKLLTEKLALIESDINKHGTFETDEAIKCIYLTFFDPNSLFNIKGLFEKMKELEEKIEKVAIQADNFGPILEQKIKALVVESHQTKIILRNIPLSKPKEKREPFFDTQAIVEQLLQLSGQRFESVSDFYRLYHKEDSKKVPSKKEKGKSPPIFISFASFSHLKAFTKKLSVIKKDKKFMQMVLENSCPPSMKIDYDYCNKEAYKLRSEKNLVTRCSITKKGVKLLVRSKNETNFTQVTYPRE